LTEFYGNLVKSVDGGENTLAVYLDLSKAFDTLPFDKLLYKLQHYGVRGISYNFFSSYLRNRNMYVDFDGCKSNSSSVVCGVPQGSVLGPLLFLIYVNDLYRAVLKSSVIQFADDTTLYKSGKCNKLLFADVNDDLKRLSVWFKSNTLSLNTSKTYYILFRSKRKKFNDEFNLLIDNSIVSRCHSIKFLGMVFDEFLSWDNHVKYIGKKLSSCLYSMNALKRCVDLNVLSKVYYSLFDTYIRYGLHLWANTSQSNINYLTKLQKKAVRILCNEKYNAHTSDLFKKLQIMNIRQSIEKSYALLIYRFSIKTLPCKIHCLFNSNADIHTYETRQREHPHFTKHRTQLYSNSFLHKAKTIWQSLPLSVQSRKTEKSFNKKISKYLIENNI